MISKLTVVVAPSGPPLVMMNGSSNVFSVPIVDKMMLIVNERASNGISI